MKTVVVEHSRGDAPFEQQGPPRDRFAIETVLS
jgi:hypothetical protein